MPRRRRTAHCRSPTFETVPILAKTYDTSFKNPYHYIRARGLGGDGPEDIISSVFAEFVVTLRNNRVSKKIETFVNRNDHCHDKWVRS